MSDILPYQLLDLVRIFVSQLRRRGNLRSSARCVHTRRKVKAAQIDKNSGFGIHSNRTKRIVIIANITDQPEEVKNTLPMAAAITAGKEALHSVRPIQTPRTVAMAFPPLKARNGENICPSTGAIAIKEHQSAAYLEVVISKSNRSSSFANI